VLTYAYVSTPFQWRLIDGEGRAHEARVGGPLHANSGELLVAAAIAGMGIIFEPDFVVGPHLARGELLPRAAGILGPKLDVWAVYPSRRHLSAKVRAFVAYLAEGLRRRSAAPPGGQAAARRHGVADRSGRPAGPCRPAAAVLLRTNRRRALRAAVDRRGRLGNSTNVRFFPLPADRVRRPSQGPDPRMPIAAALSSLTAPLRESLRPRKGELTRAAIVEAALTIARRDASKG